MVINMVENVSPAKDIPMNDIVSKFEEFCSTTYLIDKEIVNKAILVYNQMKNNLNISDNDMVWLLVALFTTNKTENDKFDKNIFEMLNTGEIYVSDFLNKLVKWSLLIRCENLTIYSKMMVKIYNRSHRLFINFIQSYSRIFSLPSTFNRVMIKIDKRKKRIAHVTSEELLYFSWTLLLLGVIYFGESERNAKFQILLISCVLQYVLFAVILNGKGSRYLLNKNFIEKNIDFLENNPTKDKLPGLSYYFSPSEHITFHEYSLEMFKGKFSEFLLSMTKNEDIFYPCLDQYSDLLIPNKFIYNFISISNKYTKYIDNCNCFIDEIKFLDLFYNKFNTLSNVELDEVIQTFNNSDESCTSSLSSNTPNGTSFVVVNRILIKSIGRIYINIFTLENEILKDDIKSINLELVNARCEEFRERSQSLNNTFINMNIEIIIGIYVNFVLKIAKNEKKNDNLQRMTNLLFSPSRHLCIFACAFYLFSTLFHENEIQLSNILELLSIDAFELFPYIEVIVSSEQNLTRDMVICFNKLEQIIISYYAWCKDSSIYKCIESNKNTVPGLKDIGFTFKVQTKVDTSSKIDFSTPKRLIKSNRTTSAKAKAKINSVKKNLFYQKSDQNTNSPNIHNNNTSNNSITDQPTNDQTNIIDTYPSKILITIDKLNSPDISNTIKYPSCNGFQLNSLIFFMRKMYHLASHRMSELCSSLCVSYEIGSHAWTCLEYLIKNHYILFMDRYLDHFIVACVYAMGRQFKGDFSITRIFKSYSSFKYIPDEKLRNVVMHPSSDNNNKDILNGNFVEFYNTILVKPILDCYHNLSIHSNSTKSNDHESQNKILISPIPKLINIENYKSCQLPIGQIYLSPKKEGIQTNILNYASLPISPIRNNNVKNNIDLIKLIPASVKRKICCGGEDEAKREQLIPQCEISTVKIHKS